MYWPTFAFLGISIHAPSRERRFKSIKMMFIHMTFQSTLPHGSDDSIKQNLMHNRISIHAPSRERQKERRQ